MGTEAMFVANIRPTICMVGSSLLLPIAHQQLPAGLAKSEGFVRYGKPVMLLAFLPLVKYPEQEFDSTSNYTAGCDEDPYPSTYRFRICYHFLNFLGKEIREFLNYWNLSESQFCNAL